MGGEMAVQKGTYQRWVDIGQSRKEHVKDGWRYGSPERSIPKSGGKWQSRKEYIGQSRKEHIKDGWRYGSPERSISKMGGDKVVQK